MENRLIISLLSVLLLCGCEGTCPPEPHTNTYFENRSSHDIAVDFSKGLPPMATTVLDGLNLPAGETAGFERGGIGFGDGRFEQFYEHYIPLDCIVTFDGDFSLRYCFVGKEDPRHHICAPGAYRVLDNETLTFTFTDADYEEALERRYETRLRFENRSGHSVTAEGVRNAERFRLFDLPAGASAELAEAKYGGFHDLAEFFDRAQLTFDGEVSKWYRSDEPAEHDICSTESYESAEEKERERLLVYTLTDADYDAALGSDSPESENRTSKTEIPCSTSSY